MKYIELKTKLDQILAWAGMIILAPVFLAIIIAIKLEDGITAPVFFSQKRVGINKTHFELYKFRSMRLDTPHDMPTHLLENPEQYITKTGRFLRKTSLDELPQMWNIARGDMAVIGPRPALWNQFDLIEERDKYGANDIKPGLTGWAQINGRDELEIPEKARLDGYYVEHMGPVMDLRCFFGTIFSVLKSDGVVEGGTGAMEQKQGKNKLLVITNHSYMLWQFRRELIAELQKRYNIAISTPFVGHEKDFEAMGCRMIETDVNRRGINPVTDFKLICHYVRIIRQEKPKKVITYSIKPNIYAGIVCTLFGVPYYVNVQGLGTAFQKPRLEKFVTVMYKIALKKARRVFFENEESAGLFLNKKIISEKKVLVLSGAGVNLEHYSYEAYPENDAVHFLYLGRIMKEKGMDELLYAIRKLRDKYGEKVVLDIVGFYDDSDEGKYKTQIDELAKEGVVLFHGFQENPKPYYAKADCVVLPSYHEGMSNVLLEAAAIGRPVITSDIPGCREAVNDGVSGYLCALKDKESLLEKMQQFVGLTKEERTAMGNAGRARMEEVFDKEKVVKKTAQAVMR